MMTPKSLLRHHDARSSWDEFTGQSRLQRLIPDKGAVLEDPLNVKRILFCSGKVYYEVAQERARNKLQSSIAMARVEQVRIAYSGTAARSSQLSSLASRACRCRSRRSRTTW